MADGFVSYVDVFLDIEPGMLVDVKSQEGEQRLVFHEYSRGLFLGYKPEDAGKTPIDDYCYGFMPEDIIVRIVR